MEIFHQSYSCRKPATWLKLSVDFAPRCICQFRMDQLIDNYTVLVVGMPLSRQQRPLFFCDSGVALSGLWWPLESTELDCYIILHQILKFAPRPLTHVSNGPRIFYSTKKPTVMLGEQGFKNIFHVVIWANNRCPLRGFPVKMKSTSHKGICLYIVCISRAP